MEVCRLAINCYCFLNGHQPFWWTAFHELLIPCFMVTVIHVFWIPELDGRFLAIWYMSARDVRFWVYPKLKVQGTNTIVFLRSQSYLEKSDPQKCSLDKPKWPIFAKKWLSFFQAMYTIFDKKKRKKKRIDVHASKIMRSVFWKRSQNHKD